MNKHILIHKTWEEQTRYNRVEVYPAKDPTNTYAFKNEKGETYNIYWIVDTYKTWRIKPRGWKRIIKRNETRIDHLKMLDQYDKDVIAFINANYPLPK